MWRLYVMALIIAIPIGIYLYRYMKRMCDTFGFKTSKEAIRTRLYMASGACAIVCLDIFGMGMIILLHLVATALVFQFINFIVKLIGRAKYKEGFSVWKKIYGSGMIPLIITVVLIVYGYINMNNVVETNYTIYTDKEIREEGYRVALISDVHFGISLDVEELQEKCEEISKKKPDIVVLCGDIIDDRTMKEDMESAFKALGTIESTYGTYYVYGNHDRQLYSDNREYTEEELAAIIESNGITILQDETYAINEEFVIAGREDNSYSRIKERMSVEELLKDIDKEAFILTLDHQPKEYAENGKAGTDLLLSGHTHGGQVWPAEYVMAWAKFDDAVYGHTQIDDDTQAIVSSGFAGWGFPVKTAAPAEYVIIDIKNK